jgi:hypothetical protein
MWVRLCDILIHTTIDVSNTMLVFKVFFRLCVFKFAVAGTSTHL